MAKRRRRKKRVRQVRIMKRMQATLVKCFVIVCVFLILLVIRVMTIQIVDGQRYQKIVLSQQGYSSNIIPYKRGDIVDAKGSVLATSVDVYNVILDCKQLNEEAAKQEKQLRKQRIKTRKILQAMEKREAKEQKIIARYKERYMKQKEKKEAKAARKKKPEADLDTGSE